MTQAFVRDPDGYYIEFCECGPLEDYLKDKTEEATQLIRNIGSLMKVKTLGERLKAIYHSSRDNSQERNPDLLDNDQVL